MRIATWNCNGAARKKIALFEQIDADILVLQECENPNISNDKDYRNWAENFLWCGSNQKKGLGIFCKNDLKLKGLQWDANNLETFLPATVNDISILAVWTKSKPYKYIEQFHQYIELHGEKLKPAKQIICGDFNSSSQWDFRYKRGNHSQAVDMLKKKQIFSMYHSLENQQQGSETNPTLYLQRNTQKPYHVDYIFASSDLISDNANIKVGDKEMWLAHSDHMPLIAEL